MPPVRLTKKNKTRPKVKVVKRKAKTTAQEIGFIGKALRGLGSLGGSALGGMVGQSAAGSNLGSSLGAGLSKWLGAGDYEVSKNTIVAKAASSIPMMHNTGQSVVVRHREFIGSISGTTNFNVAYQLTLNPGMSGTFPWLSRIATGFQEYAIKGMVFHYIPTSGTAISGTNSALGSVMIQTSYRSTEAAPASKVAMLNEYWANEVVPSDTMVHPIECDPKENPFAIHYIRSGDIVAGEPLMYDIGKTFVCTQGMQGTNVVGDLWVSYEVELKKPLISSSVTTLQGYYAARFVYDTFGTLFKGTVSNKQGNLPLTFTNNTITIPQGYAGTFVITCWLVSSGTMTNTTGNAWTGAPTVANCIITTIAGDTTLPSTHSSPSVVYNTCSYACSVIKADPSVDATIVIPTPVFTGGSTASYTTLYISNLGLN